MKNFFRNLSFFNILGIEPTPSVPEIVTVIKQEPAAKPEPTIKKASAKPVRANARRLTVRDDYSLLTYKGYILLGHVTLKVIIEKAPALAKEHGGAKLLHHVD